jgi:putative nucleotidyltransferase with HDIG domain
VATGARVLPSLPYQRRPVIWGRVTPEQSCWYTTQGSFAYSARPLMSSRKPDMVWPNTHGVERYRLVALVEHMDADTRRDARKIVHALSRSIRERDIITYTHSRRVATYAHRLARHMGWSRKLAHDLALCALVHDLGKTWIENEVLHKESALSTAERTEMERHPAIGARMLEMYGAPSFMVEAVLHHHEAFDGRGYPDHLAGESIPIAARLLSVADVFDALTSARPYKTALETSQACERICGGSGAYFDPGVVAAFMDLLDRWPNFILPHYTSAVSRHSTSRPVARPRDMVGS